MSPHPSQCATQVRARPEGGGGFAPALGGGSGANRAAGGPEGGDFTSAVPDLIRDLSRADTRPRLGGRDCGGAR